MQLTDPHLDPAATNDDRSVADTAECDVEPNVDSDPLDLAVDVPHEVVDDWTVTWTEVTRPPYSCDLVFQAALSVTEPGVSDYDESNNTDSVTVSLVRDSDDDTVVDNYEGIADNCPDDPNADQADFEGDGVGDVCDADDDNDGYEDEQEVSLGSDPLNDASTPEHISLPWTCTDGLDNDLDGLPDLLDCDSDEDGIANYFDTCPTTPEDVDGYQDDDGCPETDNDMDGICDPWLTGPACSGSDDCPNVPEDYDAFQDTDGCPDPDNDGDFFPDVTDECPGTDESMGDDGIPCTDDNNEVNTCEDYDGILDADGCHDSPGDDYDGDGFADEYEVFNWVTDPANADTDLDGVSDGPSDPDDVGPIVAGPDNCPVDHNPQQANADGDQWGDTCDSCPTTATPWYVPTGDDDCDGFTTDDEGDIGTDAVDACPDDPSDDCWPPDLNMSTTVDVTDALLFLAAFPSAQGFPGYSQRLDIAPKPPSDGVIDVTDALVFLGFFPSACTNP